MLGKSSTTCKTLEHEFHSSTLTIFDIGAPCQKLLQPFRKKVKYETLILRSPQTPSLPSPCQLLFCRMVMELALHLLPRPHHLLAIWEWYPSKAMQPQQVTRHRKAFPPNVVAEAFMLPAPQGSCILVLFFFVSFIFSLSILFSVKIFRNTVSF